MRRQGISPEQSETQIQSGSLYHVALKSRYYVALGNKLPDRILPGRSKYRSDVHSKTVTKSSTPVPIFDPAQASVEEEFPYYFTGCFAAPKPEVIADRPGFPARIRDLVRRNFAVQLVNIVKPGPDAFQADSPVITGRAFSFGQVRAMFATCCAQSASTRRRTPPSGRRVSSMTGFGSRPSTRVKRKRDSNVARMIWASIIAKLMPMHIFGPSPKGR